MDDLNSINWIPMPKAPYIIKYLFHNTGYHLMVSNLTYLYSEKLEEESILKRFRELNPFAQMKLQVILENLKKTFEKCFNQEIEFCVNLNSDKLLTISSEFSAGLVSCRYNFEMKLLQAEKITEEIITPMVFNALLSHRKILELEKKVLAYECTKSSSTSNISISTQEPIHPDWLKGKNVSTVKLLDSFLKVQSYSKELQAENRFDMKIEAPNAFKKEKSKKDPSLQSTSANKKFKPQENIDGELNSIKFEDNDEGIVIKEEEPTSSDNLTSQTKSNIKKKKVFKV